MRRAPMGVAVAGAALAMLMSSCSDSANTPRTSSSTTPTLATLPTSADIPAASVRVATNPRLGIILVDDQGLTLYKMTPESNGKVVCTGDCAKTWPPLLLAGDGQPIAGVGVPSDLTVVTRPDGGRQVAFDGAPVYRYSGDANPGEKNGQGVGGVGYAINVPAGLGADNGTASSTASGG